jgi:hypothetical protein
MEGTRAGEGFLRNCAGSFAEFIGVGSTVTTIQEKKRNLHTERLELLARYDAMTVEELKRKIREGEVPGNSAWEDLIELKNIEAEMRKIDNDMRMLPQA